MDTFVWPRRMISTLDVLDLSIECKTSIDHYPLWLHPEFFQLDHPMSLAWHALPWHATASDSIEKRDKFINRQLETSKQNQKSTHFARLWKTLYVIHRFVFIVGTLVSHLEPATASGRQTFRFNHGHTGWSPSATSRLQYQMRMDGVGNRIIIEFYCQITLVEDPFEPLLSSDS